MVKIRLRRIGTKARPYYRIVVAEGSTGRNGAFVETIGLYDPTKQPKVMEINQERALHWLTMGARPTETVAYLLNKSGVLPTFFETRPGQKKNYGFLDKRTAATSVASAVDTPVPAASE
jgi:small subunit ribosomal protein S16